MCILTGGLAAVNIKCHLCSKTVIPRTLNKKLLSLNTEWSLKASILARTNAAQRVINYRNGIIQEFPLYISQGKWEKNFHRPHPVQKPASLGSRGL